MSSNHRRFLFQLVGLCPLLLLLLCPSLCPAEELFREAFDDTNFADRGWYGNTGLILSTAEKHSGAAAAEFKYPANSYSPLLASGTGAMRKKFTPAPSVYISYYVKYSADWEVGQPNQRQREFYLLTNKDVANAGPGHTFLTVQSMLIQGRPHIEITDDSNIDIHNIVEANIDLSGITEQRAVAGCNGISDGYGAGECIILGPTSYMNRKKWDMNASMGLNGWHHVEIFVRINSIAGGKGLRDGVMQYWLDGELKRDLRDVVFRTGAQTGMLFDQLMIGPYVTPMLSHEQTFWIDELTVSTARPGSDPVVPKPPHNVRMAP